MDDLMDYFMGFAFVIVMLVRPELGLSMVVACVVACVIAILMINALEIICGRQTWLPAD